MLLLYPVCRRSRSIRVLFQLFKARGSAAETAGLKSRMEGSGTESGQAGESSSSGSAPGREAKKAKRQFDFKMHNKRHVALKMAYIGWDYHGFEIQDTVKNTIEAHLFECLQKTRMIEDPKTCNYFKCGRTDKGVSALGQVISLHLRSNLLEGPGVIVPPDSRAHERKGDKSTELPYVQILNSNLPEEIRVLAWAPVGANFSARFSCLQRTYKYFFPRGTMDLDLMREGAQKFLGEHDFRNFCKMDIGGGVTNFKRRILSFEINPISDGPPSHYQMCEMTITGLAFLWHQVRCMAALLFLIGNGLEKPEIIDHMLDIEKCPRKPQYGMAAEWPLILYDCVFEDVEWQKDPQSYQYVVSHFQQLWTAQMVRTTMLRRMLDSLELSLLPALPPNSHVAPLIQSDHKLGRSYRPLLNRPTAGTFEERHEHYQAKRRRVQEQDSAVSDE